MPMLTVGQNDCGKWNWKYATAISPARTNATGRVNRPRTIAVPPNTSRIPPMPACDISGMGGSVGGVGGKLNSFIVPLVTNISPATIRKVLSIRLVHGEWDSSKIDK